MPELSRFLRDKGGWEPQSTIMRKGRGSSSLSFLTTLLWPYHPPLYLKKPQFSGSSESSGIKCFNGFPYCNDWLIWYSVNTSIGYFEVQLLPYISHRVSRETAIRCAFFGTTEEVFFMQKVAHLCHEYFE